MSRVVATPQEEPTEFTQTGRFKMVACVNSTVLLVQPLRLHHGALLNVVKYNSELTRIFEISLNITWKPIQFNIKFKQSKCISRNETTFIVRCVIWSILRTLDRSQRGNRSLNTKRRFRICFGFFFFNLIFIITLIL